MNAAVSLMNDWAAVWGQAMFRACWIGGLVILVIWLITRCLSQLPLFARNWLWRLAYLKLLLVLAWSAPIELPLLPTDQQTLIAAPQTVRRPASPALARPIDAVTDSTNLASGIVLPAEPPEETTLSVAFCMLAVWCCGVMVCGGMVGRNWLQMNKLRTSCPPIENRLLDALNAQLCAQFGRRTAPRLLETDFAISPQLVGVFYPCIILPASLLANCRKADVRMVLAHELAHWKRRDLFWNWLPAMANMLFFFHPAVWLAQREWRLAQELACDEVAIRTTRTSAAEYGRLLLNVVRTCHLAARPSFLAVGVSPSFHGFRRRIAAMKSYRTSSALWNRSIAALLAFVAVVGLVPWRITAQEISQLTTTEETESSPAQSTSAEATPNGKKDVSDSATTSAGAVESTIPTNLRGRIFLDASLRRKNEKGQAETLQNVVISIDPNTGKWETLTQGGHTARVSPDGSTIAYQKDDGIWMCDSQRGENPHHVAAIDGRPVWSPDGKELVASNGEVNEEDKKTTPEKPVWFVETWKFNRDGSNKEWLPVPSTDFVEDWSPDGNWFVTSSDRHPPFGSGYQLYLMNPDATTPLRLTTGNGLNVYVRFSPDSKRVLFTHQERGVNSIRMINIEDGKETEIIADEGLKRVDMACWAPDGQHIVVLRQNWQIGEDGKEFLSPADPGADPRLEIMTLDGKQRRRLTLENAEVTWLGHPHWK